MSSVTYNVKFVQVETVEGLKDLQIPAGVQPGDRVRLPFMGIPDINKPSVRGDHLFIVNVQIPKRIRSTLLISYARGLPQFSLLKSLLHSAAVTLEFACPAHCCFSSAARNQTLLRSATATLKSMSRR
ncbi:chaperone protein DnaJ isoform X3 [Cucumis melo var. makuwa]|nr:chaperone protein DnaJ isoform X3 [Cucumis melo var. makuwa]